MNWRKYFSQKMAVAAIVVISVGFFSLFSTGILNFSAKNGEFSNLLGASISPTRLPVVESVFYAEAKDNPDYVPIRNWNIKDPEIGARAAMAIIPGKGKVLFKKNADERLPIASITKIMTAAVVLDSADLGEIAQVKYDHTMVGGKSSGLVVGEKISLLNLLKIMLISSGNDASEVLAEAVGEKFIDKDDILKSGRGSFLEKMNEKAVEWELSDTKFSTPSGLQSEGNFSSAGDIAVLAEKILGEYPIVWNISGIPATDVQDYEEWIKHYLTNTNKLLLDFKKIIGGKTGYTEESGECIVIIEENPRNGEYIIYVILGSDNRFDDAKKLINWVNEAFLW